MDEIRKFQNSFSKAVYTLHRKEAKCPPVIAVSLKGLGGGWYVEMKDGSFSMEVSTSQAYDVWEAKCKCIEGWQNKKGEWK